MTLTAGTRLGSYEIVSPLGTGGMGEVFLATDTRLGRQVALKVLPSAWALDDERRRRFTEEARAAAAISHPNVGTIHDVGDIDGVSYIVMEYVDGRTLTDRIAETPLAVDEIAAIGAQIAEALSAAHARGVIHRDIKPGNVMITSPGQVKVLDFGLAKRDALQGGSADDLTRQVATTPGVVLGTVSYMSPEQAIGAPLDHRTDLFSLGVLLYQLTTRRLPFSGATAPHTIDLIRHSEPEAMGRYNRDAPVELERIIRKCLEKPQAQRYQSARELAIDLQALRRVQETSRERPPDTLRHNLPAELTSFVGRKKEMADLPRALASSRLVSLTGSGGAGKTRLAVRIAWEVLPEFADGVWLIDLASLSAPDLVAQTIATVLGIREGPQRSVQEALQENLRHRQLLLVLDNCEHLIDTCAELADVLLRGAPALRILATSREALGVSGEMVCRVPSLSLPDAAAPSTEAVRESEATRLFIDRATATDSAFAVTPVNAAAIADICRRLDGIPLAIELAAARVNVLAVEQINARLQDRFRLLTGGARTAIARQRTLEATVDWSYQLLSEAERLLFARLSVFPASWTLDAAEAVCGGEGIDQADMLDLLSRLVSKSLVTLERDVADERRYRFLETVRQYARERLMQAGATDRLRLRHFEYFFNEFRGAMPVLRHGQQLPLLRRLRVEQENVRAALEWAQTTPDLNEKGVELAGALFWYWTKRGLYEEGRQWLERACAVPDMPGRLRARALIGLAHMDHFQGRHAESVTKVDEVLALGRAEDDGWAVTFALFMQGLAAFELGDHQRAVTCAIEAGTAADAYDEAIQRAGPLMILANVAMAGGDHARAEHLYDEAIAICRGAGEVWGLGIQLAVSAGVLIVRQDFDRARAHASEALTLCQELEDPRGIAWSLDVFAALLATRGHAEAAARIWGAVDGLLASVGGSLNPTISWIRDRYFEPVKASLGAADFEAIRDNGRKMSPAQAIALARAETL